MAADRDKVRLTFRALIEAVLRQLHQLRRDRDKPLLVARVMLGLGAADRQPAALRIYVRLRQQMRF